METNKLLLSFELNNRTRMNAVSNHPKRQLSVLTIWYVDESFANTSAINNATWVSGQSRFSFSNCAIPTVALLAWYFSHSSFLIPPHFLSTLQTGSTLNGNAFSFFVFKLVAECLGRFFLLRPLFVTLEHSRAKWLFYQNSLIMMKKLSSQGVEWWKVDCLLRRELMI